MTPAIDTDLVGELVEMRRDSYVFARGLCRAVTAFGCEGGVWIWLEVRTEQDRASYETDYGADKLPALGDVMPIYLEASSMTQRIRIHRGAALTSKPDPLALADKLVAEFPGNAAAEAVVDLARAVIARDAELSAPAACLRCGRGDLQLRGLLKHYASCMSRTDEENRLDQLAEECGHLKYLNEKLQAENDGLREQASHLAHSDRIGDWARDLLVKYDGYPHLNADPFDSLDMGQRQMLIWEYARELSAVVKENARLRAALDILPVRPTIDGEG